MPKYDDFDLDIQNTTTKSNDVQPASWTPISCMCTPRCTALCTPSCPTTQCEPNTTTCPPKTYNIMCKR